MVNKRVWSLAEYSDSEKMAEKLKDYSWTLCTGFKMGDYAFVNDSFSEDGAAEYAVVNLKTMRQIESITFGWCSYYDTLKYIEEAVMGRMDGVMSSPVNPSAFSHGKASCRLCA